MKRVCLGIKGAPPCGVLISTGQRRCLRHRRMAERQRGTTAERGYGAAHQRAAREAVRAEPWCHWPGCYATTDLTAQHLIPGEGEGGYTVLCRKHNTIEATQRRVARLAGRR